MKAIAEVAEDDAEVAEKGNLNSKDSKEGGEEGLGFSQRLGCLEGVIAPKGLLRSRLHRDASLSRGAL